MLMKSIASVVRQQHQKTGLFTTLAKTAFSAGIKLII